MSENEDGGCEIQVADSSRKTKAFVVRLNVVSTSVLLFLRLIASFVVAAYDGWIRRKCEIVGRVKNRLKLQLFSLVPTNFVTSLTEIVLYRGKIGTVFHVFSVIDIRPRIWKRDENPKLRQPEPEPEKSVNCEILSQPVGNIRADVIFIHGLHGSVVHTWKQGVWNYRKNVQNTQLEHKFKLTDDSTDKGSASEDEAPSDNLHRSGSRRRVFSDSKQGQDVVLKNITDIINNIDDTIKERSNKAVKDDPYTACWPKDWLPQDCPGIRVIAVNYTTDPFLWRPVWITKRIRTSMTERSEEMEDHLLKLGVGEHPIVWVGHSKGGLFVKQMLVDANNSDDPALKNFLHQTKAMMFYSVPHRGSSLANINLPLLRQSIELIEVKKDCKEVSHLHNQFMKLYEKKILSAEVYSFVETVLTFMFVTNVRVVSVDSADIGFGVFKGVNIDHREICKPINRDCFLYKELVDLINRVV
ncbi:UNVERIFIED_CONTAM: hypothetical protein PYX00_007266 [Menopon gallinae]|uniref:Protein SERAC1 n=1 Tax=Menopon gallinae TaxID=328185 RepID=A0AAW2HIG6_9NEOP